MLRRFVAFLWIAAVAVGLQAPAWAAAEAIELTSVSLQPAPTGNETWLLSADFDLDLGPALEEAVSRGLPLYFVADFELTRPRWWWWDDKVVTASRTWRLSYHALTRQYRLALGGYVQRFSSLAEALAAIARVRGWPVLERERLRPGGQYVASVRLRLDTAQLPKPLQMNAMTGRDWNPSAEWTRFPFTPETAKSAP